MEIAFHPHLLQHLPYVVQPIFAAGQGYHRLMSSYLGDQICEFTVSDIGQIGYYQVHGPR